ncbi:hypothetical protein JTE90_015100 [Oedothorax gibbosus]|uniref:Transposase n=1 Tax=Oedothorax gibbosus TaxID=931172 RepID=A0AAV6VT08_9ARAC|nr:hypothetical protein JTE90_015100 [Oedothorax gibbosus]
MLELSQKMKEFFEKLKDLNKSRSTEGDGMLSDWLYFEKKCGIYQTKGKKSRPIMVVVLNHAEYHKKLIEGHDFPTAIVLLEG